jgi:hypothetical protein
MKILTYVPLTKAQEATIGAFESVEVRTALIKPVVVATFQTFQTQEVKVSINEDGVIVNIYVEGMKP